MRTAFLLSLILAAPIAFAASSSLPAGFAPGSIWLSRTSVVEGSAVTIYTVVYDSSAVAITGDVVFTVDGESLGTRHVTIDAGQTQIVSYPWNAVVGVHTIAAHISNPASGTSTTTSTLSQDATGEISISVDKKPTLIPSTLPTVSTLPFASSTIQAIASVSPQAATVAKTVFDTTETVRKDAVTTLTNLANGTTTPAGKVLGVSDYKAGGSLTPTTSPKQAGAGMYLAVLHFLIAIFSSPLWFYLLLLIVLIFLIMLVKTMLGERQRNRRRR